MLIVVCFGVRRIRLDVGVGTKRLLAMVLCVDGGWESEHLRWLELDEEMSNNISTEEGEKKGHAGSESHTTSCLFLYVTSWNDLDRL